MSPVTELLNRKPVTKERALHPFQRLHGPSRSLIHVGEPNLGSGRPTGFSEVPSLRPQPCPRAVRPSAAPDCAAVVCRTSSHAAAIRRGRPARWAAELYASLTSPVSVLRREGAAAAAAAAPGKRRRRWPDVRLLQECVAVLAIDQSPRRRLAAGSGSVWHSAMRRDVTRKSHYNWTPLGAGRQWPECGRRGDGCVADCRRAGSTCEDVRAASVFPRK